MPNKTSVFVCFCLFAISLGSSLIGQEEVDFNRDIRPILSDKCFQCHGPDEAARKAELRLDVGEDAHDNAFVPSSLDDSEAWQRIVSDDKDTVMPPPKSHKDLSDEEKTKIKRWIESGAQYDLHWSFRKVAKPDPPKVVDLRFARSAIDKFVWQAMKSRGMEPAPQATRESLIRRVTLDLTGLPATPSEVDSFLDDQAPNAFEKVVDRLLASPHFGERMAVDWMDVARYGDTSVFHADGPRDMWRWRDWVVDSYNNNLPFDQFTIKQLAGDLLPEKTIEDHLASGFNRNNASSDEGGAIAEEYRVEYVVDRVKTTSMVWMGLSMECAQCHDHKYDPISQEDYYRFFAFFNQAADPGMQSRKGNQSPIITLLDQEKIAKVPAVEEKVTQLNQQLAEIRNSPEQKKAFDKWLTVVSESIDDARYLPLDTESFFILDQADESQVVNQSNADDKVKLNGKPDFPEGKFGRAIRTKGNQFLSSAETGKDFAGDTGISFGCWLQLKGGQSGAPLARMNDSNSHVGFDLYLQNNQVATHFINKWPENAIKVAADKKLEKNKWYHVFISYDGSKKARGIRIFVDGERLEHKPSHDSLKGSTVTEAPFTVGRRTSGSHFDGLVDDVRFYDRELSESEIAVIAEADPLTGLLAIEPEERTEEQDQQLFDIFLQREVDQFTKLNKKIAQAREEITKLNAPLTTVMVMKDEPKPRMTYVLDRGQYDLPNKDKSVEAGVPTFLPEFGDKYEQNRLGMAKWLTSPDHPLTARVTVNRIWKLFFGTGIVESVEDFGLQGTSPSHPQLLDWLASDFVSSGWDTKQLIKTIVMSQTYQQSSAVTASQLEIDPGNRFVSRGPRFRLSGEFLRDQALAVSGLLNRKMGGPGVKPYQPEGLWNEVSLDKGLRFKQDTGDKLYRRSLYTYWRRSSPPPNMVLFDAPTREKCTVRRGRTNTPLQALVLMNDPQFVEAAKLFAQRILNDGGTTTKERIEFGFKHALARTPTDDEIQVLAKVFESEHKTFQQQPKEAKKLISVGETPVDQQFDAADVAAWTIISNLIFNLDEFVTRG